MIFFFQETVNKLLLNFFHDKQKTKCEWDIKFNLKFLSMGELGVDWGHSAITMPTDVTREPIYKTMLIIVVVQFYP